MTHYSLNIQGFAQQHVGMVDNRNTAALEDRRFQAFALYREGIRQAEIARQLRVSRAAVCQWLRRAKTKGQAALTRKPRPGRPPKLTSQQLRSVVKLLALGAEHAGYSTQLWTAERIQRLVLDRCGARYHVNHIPKLLRQCGWSYQRSTELAVERNEAEVQQWVREEWPRTRKRPAGRKPR